MDVLSFHGRDDNVPPCSNDESQVESPVFRLPPELLMLIFRLCSSEIKNRLILTHTCRQWRLIAVNNPSLWTNIFIETSFGKQNARLGHFLSILGMQLDRTANMLLNVKWIAEICDESFVGTLQLIRKKAPFSRWRTLKLHMSGGSHQDAPWSSVDTFTNLECLHVWPGTEDTILGLIDRTITSRLDVLDLTTCPAARQAYMIASFAKSFTHISTLLFESLHSIRDTSFLPDSVVNLQLHWGQDHPFPYIQTYELVDCVFDRTYSVDLRNMTTLVVADSLTIRSNCHVFLPAFRELKLRALSIGISAKIEAPALDILYLTNGDDSGDGFNTDAELLTDTNSSLLDPGYLLSPNTSIIADSYLSSIILINLLAKSPKVTNATLRFDGWAGAQVVLERLVGFGTQADTRSAEKKNLCPRLSELRLDFGWEFSDSSASKEWLLDGTRARRGAGITLPLSIYVGWKGEGRYVLLTGD